MRLCSCYFFFCCSGHNATQAPFALQVGELPLTADGQDHFAAMSRTAAHNHPYPAFHLDRAETQTSGAIGNPSVQYANYGVDNSRPALGLNGLHHNPSSWRGEAWSDNWNAQHFSANFGMTDAHASGWYGQPNGANGAQRSQSRPQTARPRLQSQVQHSNYADHYRNYHHHHPKPSAVPYPRADAGPVVYSATQLNGEVSWNGMRTCGPSSRPSSSRTSRSSSRTASRTASRNASRNASRSSRPASARSATTQPRGVGASKKSHNHLGLQGFQAGTHAEGADYRSSQRKFGQFRPYTGHLASTLEQAPQQELKMFQWPDNSTGNSTGCLKGSTPIAVF